MFEMHKLSRPQKRTTNEPYRHHTSCQLVGVACRNKQLNTKKSFWARSKKRFMVRNAFCCSSLLKGRCSRHQVPVTAS
uniref:Uncharacterized protein n=1 Tax=Anguilla anguilla TaxID=7936 RepID=A0A0E9UJY4_ANGAN